MKFLTFSISMCVWNEVWWCITYLQTKVLVVWPKNINWSAGVPLNLTDRGQVLIWFWIYVIRTHVWRIYSLKNYLNWFNSSAGKVSVVSFKATGENPKINFERVADLAVAPSIAQILLNFSSFHHAYARVLILTTLQC